MSKLVRFGVSMDAELLAAFDHLLSDKGYANRSEAIRDMVRDAIVESHGADDKKPIVAALCIVYDHHAGQLAQRLTAIQHDHGKDITATLHVHLDTRNCLEVIVLRGPAGTLRRLADRLIATRGVKHGQLVIATTGKPPA